MSSSDPSPRSSINHGLNGLYTQQATAVDVANFKPMDAEKWPGNKEALWTLKSDQHTLNLMHNAIRAEVTKFESLLFRLGDRELKKWEKDAIKVRVRERRSRRAKAPPLSPPLSPAFR